MYTPCCDTEHPNIEFASEHPKSLDWQCQNCGASYTVNASRESEVPSSAGTKVRTLTFTKGA